jgi:hypothetical protein
MTTTPKNYENLNGQKKGASIESGNPQTGALGGFVTRTRIDGEVTPGSPESDLGLPGEEDATEETKKGMTIEEAERQVRDMFDDKPQELNSEIERQAREDQKVWLRQVAEKEHDGSLQKALESFRASFQKHEDAIQEGERTGDWIDDETGENLEAEIRRNYTMLKFDVGLLEEMVAKSQGRDDVEKKNVLSPEEELSVLEPRIRELEAKTTNEMSDEFWDNATDEQMAENAAAWEELEALSMRADSLRKKI